jgi:pimeloyl-ACP methyl ester carboxylesterase
MHRLASGRRARDGLDAARARDGLRNRQGKSYRPGLTFADAELAAIQHPTLHVYGTADHTAGAAEIWSRVADALPRGELRLVEGAGHMPWFDDSTRVAEEVRRFLAG